MIHTEVSAAVNAAWEYLHAFHFSSVVLRICLAILVGGMIGLERGRKRRPAGFRTYMFVCLGAALAMLLGQYEYEMLGTRWASDAAEIGTMTDVSRFGAQVINGIGFIGAGTIIVTGRQKIKGLTTAAGLWASACIGLSIGAGFYEGAVLAFVFAFLCMRFFPVIDTYIWEKSKILNIYIEFDSIASIGTIIGKLKAQNVEIYDIDLDSGSKKRVQRPNIVFSVNLHPQQTHTQILSALSALDCIHVIKEI